ncbi:DUF305 domain-containing protein [Streptomyces sp. NPDC006186]|uniref:DUF305 domain-containing protein n=1 Tax=Streptomyces sp. NPDC006186 TaxID=3155248 RepID=UPI0033A380CB
MSSTRTPVRAALAALAVGAAFALTACGGDSGTNQEGHAAAPAPSATASAGAHNAQDVAFAQGMIPHHRQALDMAAQAATKASSTQVKELARRIGKAQDPEIGTMSGWLTSWGEEVPQPGATQHSAGHSGQSGHSGHAGMPGMMDDEDMAKLEKASGKAFDTLFLQLMTEHHEGAVRMAMTEQTEGRYGPAKAMADAIVTAQKAEIEEMRKLLAG